MGKVINLVPGVIQDGGSFYFYEEEDYSFDRHIGDYDLVEDGDVEAAKKAREHFAADFPELVIITEE